MTIQSVLREYLNTTDESMRALSLRAGLGAKTVAHIMTNIGQRPRHRTLSALSAATNIPIEALASGERLQSFQELLDILGSSGKPSLVSRIRWLLRKADWFGNRPVCRRDVIDFFDRNNAASVGLTSGSYATYKSDILSAIDAHGARNRKRGIMDCNGEWAEAHRIAKEAELPKSSVMNAGAFLTYLCDENISLTSITPVTLRAYYDHRIATSPATEKRCRKHLSEVETFLKHISVLPAAAHLEIQAVRAEFSNLKDKFDVDNGLLAPLLHEFDTRVAPWARGEVSRTGQTQEEFIAALDAAYPPLSDKEARLKAATDRRRLLATGQPKTSQHNAGLVQAGFLTAKSRWNEKTTRTRRGYVVALAKAVIADTEVVPDSMAELVSPSFLTAAVVALKDANSGSGPSGYIGSVLKAIKKIAVGYVGVSVAHTAAIEGLIKDYGHSHRGIAPRNKAKLNRFTPERIQATIDLSGTVLEGINGKIASRRKAHRKGSGEGAATADIISIEMARDVAAAVAHDILMARAPRSANVIEARLDWVSFTNSRARLTIPAVEVKARAAGDADYVVVLGEQASDLLRSYIDFVRPILARTDPDCPYLFPGPGQGKPYGNLLQRVTKLLHRHVGVEINPHLYRHLVGYIWLKDRMSNLPKVQKLLGHKSIQTTIAYYAELDEELVFDEWQQRLEQKRTAAKPRPRLKAPRR